MVEVTGSSPVSPTSVATCLHCWIQRLQFDPGIIGSEAPIHGGAQLVALVLPGGGLRAQSLGVGDTPGQGLEFEHIDFDLSDVEPAGMLGRVDPCQTTGNAPGRSSLIPCLEHTGLVGVEVVADQGDALRLGKVPGHEVFQDLGEILLGAPRGHLYMPPAHKGGRDQQQIGCAHAPVLVILAEGLCRQRGAHFLGQHLETSSPHTTGGVGSRGRWYVSHTASLG